MKHLLTLLALLTILASPAAAQTIKTLGYNTTNGQIVAATNAVWTNAFNFSTNTVAGQVRTNLGLGAAWLTNTNVTNFRTDIGLGTANSVQFDDILAASIGVGVGATSRFTVDESMIEAGLPISFANSGAQAESRTNLGLGLAALTNSSNVTTMRALGGSTNTNEPYSGTVALTNTNVLTFSNGVLLNIQ
jgi:hypothetical protein